MLDRLTAWIASCAKDWRLVAGTFLCQMLLLVVMLQLVGPFERETGHQPFDFQPELTTGDIAAQLPAYNATARALYYGIAAVDFLFPLLGGLFFALLLALGLRAGWPEASRAGAQTWWPLLPFIGTLFDWTENVIHLLLIATFPPVNDALAGAAVVAKRAKMIAVTANAVSAVLLLTVGFARQRSRRARESGA